MALEFTEFEVLMQGFTDQSVVLALMCWKCGAEFIEVRGMVLKLTEFDLLLGFTGFKLWLWNPQILIVVLGIRLF